MSKHIHIASGIALCALLAGCGGDRSESRGNGVVTHTGIDPILTDELGKQIVIDPRHINDVASADDRTSDIAPPSTVTAAGVAACDFTADPAWSGKLPPAVPVYPAARIAEASGSDAAGCRRRIVSFTAAAPPAKLLDYYRTRVTAAGYSAEHLVEGNVDVLGGTRGQSAYYLTIRPIPSGSAVDLVAN
jgi:hypothetical protein